MSAVDHVYTASPERRDILIAGYHRLEGVAGFIFTDSTGAPGSVPLYAVATTGGGHLYTTSAAERDAVVAAGGTAEPDVGYVLPAPQQGTIPLFRLYNESLGDHVYTVSDGERDELHAHSGYRSEDTACYVLAHPSEVAVPLYRLVGIGGGATSMISTSRTPATAVYKIPAKDEGGNWRPLKVPGARWLDRGGGYGEYLIELRGWVHRDRAEWYWGPGEDGDWTCNLELDPEWLDELRVTDNQLFTVGSIMSLSWAGEADTHIDQGPPFQLPRPMHSWTCGLPTVHVEVCGWGGNWTPGSPPDDWVAAPGNDFVYPFRPDRALPWQAPLQKGDYVRMFGSLVTDVAHEESLWGAPGEADAPARWTELHPVDVIEVLPPKPRPINPFDPGASKTADGSAQTSFIGLQLAAFGLPGTRTDFARTFSLPPGWSPEAPSIGEDVLRGSMPGTVVGGRPGQGALIEARPDSFSLTVSVAVPAGAGLLGRFAAIYRIDRQPRRSSRLAVTTDFARLAAGERGAVRADAATDVEWRALEGEITPSGGGPSASALYRAPYVVDRPRPVTLRAISHDQPPRTGDVTFWIEQGKRGFWVLLSNGDDVQSALLNQVQVASAGFSKSKTVAFGELQPTDRVTVEVFNAEGCYSWGIKAGINDHVIFDETRGLPGGPGANLDDRRHENQVVRRIEFDGAGSTLENWNVAAANTTVHLANADDVLMAWLNADTEPVGMVRRGEAASFDLGDLSDADRLTFTVFNEQGPYSWGIEVQTGGQIVYRDWQGTPGGPGANNDDRTKTNTVVYTATINRRGERIDIPPQPDGGE